MSIEDVGNFAEAVVDDLAEVVREGRPLQPGASLRVEIGDENLNFKAEIFDDPCPLGRRLIERAGCQPVEEHVVVAIMQNGDFEEIRLDEPYNLRGCGVEKILIFRTDRVFKFKIDGRDLEWPHPCISGFVLKKLANLASNYSLWLDVPGGHDRKIQDTDLISLDEPGIECFISIIDQTTEGRDILPSVDHPFLEGADYDIEVSQEGSETGVIFKDFLLPEGKYDHSKADVLIILPLGYPDFAPDMFFTFPRVTLQSTGQAPRATNGNRNFVGKTWQQWSRHNNAWRPGVDNLRTMIARAITAMQDAG